MDKRLRKEFEEYCKLNEIEDVEDFIGKCTKDGFTLDKYGVAPFLPKSQIQEIPVEKEVIKEVIVEVPVEKEVIIEKIITKEIDNTELLTKLETYQKELLDKDKTINEQQTELKKQEDILEHFKKVTVNRRAQYMKSSHLNDTYLD
tara:strand:+ start:4274 stop:4711 length:438 start_codon:yes stop_codon:yes gene_type:complete